MEQRFASALAAGPRAETRSERRALLREANLAIVGQVRAGHARPWAKGDADETARAFLCEYGDPSCDRSVDVRVGVAAAASVLAPGHVP